MLAVLITVLVAIGTSGLLLNVLISKAYFGQAPRGDSAVGLVIPLFVTIIAGLLLIFASLLCAFRGSAVLQSIHSSQFIAGIITVVVTLGVVLAAGVAFACWCEAGMIARAGAGARAGSVIVLLLGWFGGIIGPLLLAMGLLCGAWLRDDGVLGEPHIQRPLKVVFISLALLAVVGYTLRGIGLYQTVSRQVANRAVAFAREARAQLAPGASVEQELTLHLASLPTDAPLSSVVELLMDHSGSVKLSATCRQLLVDRALKVSDLDNAMILTVASKAYSDRRGIFEFLDAVPIETIRSNQEAWGVALQVGIECDADAISCRPTWLTETFDGKSDPLGHIQSLLVAVERFKGLPSYGSLTKAVQQLADATSQLNNDGNLKKLLRVLEKAGYQPVSPRP